MKIMEKLLALAITAVLIFSALSGCGVGNATSESETKSDTSEERASTSTQTETQESAKVYLDFEYTVFEDEVTITRYNGVDTAVTTPREIDGMPVKSIGAWAFSYSNYALTITIPDSIIYIGDNAFYECANLTHIEISENVWNIGHGAFFGCKKLATIVVPSGVPNMGSGAFAYCENLTIYCRMSYPAANWHENWNPDNRPVEWGYIGE